MFRARRMSAQLPHLDAVGGEALLGEAQRHLLAQHAQAVDLAHLLDGLEGPLHQLGEVVHLPVGVLLTRHRQQPGAGFGRIPDDHGLPAVGMELGDPEPLQDEALQVRR